jgi:hypothetical protein
MSDNEKINFKVYFKKRKEAREEEEGVGGDDGAIGGRN